MDRPDPSHSRSGRGAAHATFDRSTSSTKRKKDVKLVVAVVKPFKLDAPNISRTIWS